MLIHNMDDLIIDAVKLVVHEQTASVSMLQRYFRIGYTRAARLIDTMAAREIIGGYEGSKPRTVLKQKDDLEEVLQNLWIENPELYDALDIQALNSLSKNMTANTTNATELNKSTLEKTNHLNEQFIKLTTNFKALQSENEQLKEQLLHLQEENNFLKEKWQRKSDDFSRKYEQAESEFETTKTEIIKEYNQLLKIHSDENNKIIDDLLNNDLLEKLQEQYYTQLSKYNRNIEALNHIVEKQREQIEITKENQFTLTREIIISTESFVDLLKRSIDTHNNKENFKNKSIFFTDKQLTELLQIFEVALNDITPLFSYNKKIRYSRLGKIREYIEGFFINFQAFFMEKNIIPPQNIFLDKINDFMLDDDNHYPIINVIYLFYGALLTTILSNYETCEIVSVAYLLERNKENVEIGFNNFIENIKKQSPYRSLYFKNTEEYLQHKLAEYSGLEKIRKDLHANQYVQKIISGLRKDVADKFIYDEVILETYKDKNTFYILGCEETGVYKFGVTSKHVFYRLDANSKMAYRDLDVKEFKLLKELATNHALAIENHFIKTFIHQSKKLNYGKEWVVLDKEEAQYLLHGIWEQDEQLNYILSSSPEA